MRLIVLPISIFGAIGTPGQAFISELSRRVGGLVPFSLLPHASWATPRVGPMIRMALTHAVRRGLTESIHTHWHRDAGTAGGAGEDAECDVEPGCSFGAWLRPWRDGTPPRVHGDPLVLVLY